MNNSDFLILIIEDDQDLCALLRKILTDAGYNTIVANDGQEATQILEKQIPHLVLLDVQMPSLDGYHIIEWIRSHQIISEIIVIMLTMLKQKKDIISFLNLGADDYIVKPVPIATLLEKLKNQLQQKQQRITKTLKINTIKKLDASHKMETTQTQLTKEPNSNILYPANLTAIGENGLAFQSKAQFTKNVPITLEIRSQNKVYRYPRSAVEDSSLELNSNQDFSTTIRFLDPQMNNFITGQNLKI